ncbi:hypothetical protein JW711_05190 [Candidatus Woesearchaeota archaeon]|nr:hypothetical protein [Candidatus Woesearchaeota archaeon]
MVEAVRTSPVSISAVLGETGLKEVSEYPSQYVCQVLNGDYRPPVGVTLGMELEQDGLEARINEEFERQKARLSVHVTPESIARIVFALPFSSYFQYKTEPTEVSVQISKKYDVRLSIFTTLYDKQHVDKYVVYEGRFEKEILEARIDYSPRKERLNICLEATRKVYYRHEIKLEAGFFDAPVAALRKVKAHGLREIYGQHRDLAIAAFMQVERMNEYIVKAVDAHYKRQAKEALEKKRMMRQEVQERADCLSQLEAIRKML